MFMYCYSATYTSDGIKKRTEGFAFGFTDFDVQNKLEKEYGTNAEISISSANCIPTSTVLICEEGETL
jgi:hypothetical protein